MSITYATDDEKFRMKNSRYTGYSQIHSLTRMNLNIEPQAQFACKISVKEFKTGTGFIIQVGITYKAFGIWQLLMLKQTVRPAKENIRKINE